MSEPKGKDADSFDKTGLGDKWPEGQDLSDPNRRKAYALWLVLKWIMAISQLYLPYVVILWG